METERTISEDSTLAMANAMAVARHMKEFATVYKYDGKYAFRLVGDTRPLVADEIVWSTDPQMSDRAVVFSRGV
tara:strand:+ start:1934 stop:2155 length:222 start_codon:yes stop_codon:yes gene_type:complete